MNRKLEQIIEIFNDIEINNMFLSDEKCFKYILSISIKNPVISKPTITEKDGSMKMMLPNDARLRNMTYAAPLTVDVHVTAKTFTSEMGYITNVKRLSGVSLGRIPIMVRSTVCMLSQSKMSHSQYDECQNDYGGYFIINGSEKVLISQDRIAENVPFVFLNTKASCYSHVAEIRSVPEARCSVPKTVTLKYGNRTNTYGTMIRICMSNIRHDIPLMIVFRALGIISDKDVLDMIVHPKDPNAPRIMQAIKGSIEEASFIKDEETALRYLASVMTTSYNTQVTPVTLARNMLHRDFLPHVGPVLSDKALFLGYMTSRLIQCVIGLSPLDDRDSYINKRLDSPGVLLGNLFRQYYGKVIKDMRMLIQKDINSGSWRSTGNLIDVMNKSNVYKMIKATIIEAGLKYGLATGNWGMKSSRMRQGVAQVLNRMTYGATLSHLRRVNTPIEKTGKLVQPRKLHSTQWGIMCPSETPEGASVGLVKNLALLTTITHASPSEFVKAAILRFGGLITLPSETYMANANYTLIFINGMIMGVHARPDLLVRYLRDLKLQAALNIFMSIIWNVAGNKVTICTDSGRFSRPLLVVDPTSGRLVLEQLIPGLWTDFSKLTDWHLLVLGGAIEYLDVEETNTAMIAMSLDDLNSRRCRFTHMEVAPFAMLGIMAGSIPFSHHNQAPRNTYQSAMGKQAIGISMLNFRHRFDTVTHVLTYPQMPIVSTHTARVVQCNSMPNGTNAIVAFACFTGFNQEDSVIINQSAVERGLLTTLMYRTLREQNAKNHSTGEEEFFCRPDRMSMRTKPYNYDKLGDNGFVKEGTSVDVGDVIIGKCMPQKTGSGILHKDTSIIIKGHNETGVVDRNCQGNRHFTNITGDGYTFAKVRIRQERKPTIGDKVSCYTEDHDVLTSEGWVPIADARGHQVATLTYYGDLVYVRPKEFQQYQHEGTLLEIEGAGVSLLVTPTHRVFTMKKDGTWGMQEALVHVGKTTTHLKCVQSYFEDFMSTTKDNSMFMLGYWMSEHNDANSEFPSENLAFPRWCTMLEPLRASSLILGWFKGSLQNVRNDIFSSSLTCHVSSTLLADQLQQIALHAGIACNINIISPSPSLKIEIEFVFGEDNVVTNAQTICSPNVSRTVFCCSIDDRIGPGLLYVRRKGKVVWCGNSRHGQKGTIGMLYKEEDMPFTGSGIVPSIIVNPHAIPSRMTIGQLMEALECKAGAISGSMRDATPFCGRTLDDIIQELEGLGVSSTGDEVMYNPRTGEQVKCAVFMCPTYYQRLKHMTADKVHSRAANGPVVLLTRQPAEGRARDGGLRVGEMELECLWAHGMTAFLKERFMECSDNYRIFVCMKCLMMAIVSPEQGVYMCKYCNNLTQFEEVRIPYASKLFIQEVETMAIGVRIWAKIAPPSS